MFFDLSNMQELLRNAPQAIYSGDEYVYISPSELLPNFWSNHVRHSGNGGTGWIPELLWRLVVPAFIFTLLWSVTRIFTSRVVFPKLAKKFGVKSPKQSRKLSYQLWLLLFYTSSTLYALLFVTPGQPWATSHGGPGYMHFWLNHPQLPSVVMSIYLLYEIGFYMAELFAIFIEDRRSDFAEYVFHHILTLLLLSNAWVCLDHRAGGVILLLHDLSDIFLCLVKVFYYTKCQKLSSIAFGTFALVFAYCRLYWFPQVIYAYWFVRPAILPATVSHWANTLMLTALQLLHVYWFMLIIRMTIRLLRNSKSGDVRSDDEEECQPVKTPSNRVASNKAADAQK